MHWRTISCFPMSILGILGVLAASGCSASPSGVLSTGTSGEDLGGVDAGSKTQSYPMLPTGAVSLKLAIEAAGPVYHESCFDLGCTDLRNDLVSPSSNTPVKCTLKGNNPGRVTATCSLELAYPYSTQCVVGDPTNCTWVVGNEPTWGPLKASVASTGQFFLTFEDPDGPEETGAYLTGQLVGGSNPSLTVSVNGFASDGNTQAWGEAPLGVTCPSGTCGCDGGKTACGAACVELGSDPANCGACGNACAAGGFCVNGGCVACQVGTTACGTSCRDLSSDLNNCGACDHRCGYSEGCVSGSCVTPTCTGGLTACGGQCVDTEYDPNNCGGCGYECPSGNCNFNLCIGGF